MATWIRAVGAMLDLKSVKGMTLALSLVSSHSSWRRAPGMFACWLVPVRVQRRGCPPCLS
jgi:hypothetical protein